MNDESDEKRGYGPALVVIEHETEPLSKLESTVDRNRDGHLVSMVKTVHYCCSYVHPDGSINNTTTVSARLGSLTTPHRQSTAEPKTSPDLHLSFR